MNFCVEYNELVVKSDIPKITNREKERIRRGIEEKLQVRPELFGKPLRNSLKNYRSLRISDYRVIYRISWQVVKIFIIQHRSQVYKKVFVRISD